MTTWVGSAMTPLDYEAFQSLWDGLKDAPCVRCAERQLIKSLAMEFETFELFKDGTGRPISPARRFCINRARQLVATRTPIVMPREVMTMLRDTSEFERAHLDHVDPALPGIVAHFEAPHVTYRVLIDGIHRLARCLRDDLPFAVQPLTVPDTLAIEFTLDDMPALAAEFCPNAKLRTRRS